MSTSYYSLLREMNTCVQTLNVAGCRVVLQECIPYKKKYFESHKNHTNFFFGTTTRRKNHHCLKLHLYHLRSSCFFPYLAHYYCFGQFQDIYETFDSCSFFWYHSRQKHNAVQCCEHDWPWIWPKSIHVLQHWTFGKKRILFVCCWEKRIGWLYYV